VTAAVKVNSQRPPFFGIRRRRPSRWSGRLNKLPYLQVEGHHEHGLAALHSVDQGGVAEHAAEVFGEGFEEAGLGLLLSGQSRVIREKCFEEGARFGQNDAADIFVGRQLGELLGNGDRSFEAAEFVDQAVGLGLSAGPYPALAEGVDLLDCLISSRCDLWNEVVEIDAVGLLLHFGAFLGRPFLSLAKDAGILTAESVFIRNTEPVVKPLNDRFAHENTDRARDGSRFGNDLIGIAGYVIASGSSDITHRHNDGLFGLGVLDRVPHHIGRKGRTARRIDPEDDGLYAFVICRSVYGLDDRVRADHLAGQRAVARLADIDRTRSVDNSYFFAIIKAKAVGRNVAIGAAADGAKLFVLFITKLGF
jgi:hypothetical protein